MQVKSCVSLPMLLTELRIIDISIATDLPTFHLLGFLKSRKRGTLPLSGNFNDGKCCFNRKLSCQFYFKIFTSAFSLLNCDRFRHAKHYLNRESTVYPEPKQHFVDFVLCPSSEYAHVFLWFYVSLYIRNNRLKVEHGSRV